MERAGRPRGPLFREVEAGSNGSGEASPLREMTLPERLTSDIVGTGVTVGPHPMALYRPSLAARGVLRAVDLGRFADGSRVTVAGAVICRQRPGTAKGFLFLTLEDETGLVNAIVRPDLFEKRHQVLVSTGVLEVEGIVQSQEGLSIRATELRPAGAAVVSVPSRDFR